MSALATQKGNLPATSEATSMLAVISRAASDPSVDIEKLERLMAMKERMDAKEAETAFAGALARVQSQMGRIGTDALNKQTGSRYATYGALDRVLRPIYTAEGFSLSFGTEPAPDGMVGVVCYVSHQGGHTREYRAQVPSDGKGIKGNSMMTATHAFGSGTSYGMRYLLKMVFNVAVGEEDDDGNGASHAVNDDNAASIIGQWLEVIRKCPDAATLTARKAECIKAYGMADKVPPAVRSAFVARGKELGA